MTGEYGDQVHKMRFEVDITPTRLAVVALSPLGITLFTLVQNRGERLIVTRVKELAALDPRYILFDLYLTYWPRESLQEALTPLAIRLEENDDGSVRRVRDADGQLIAEITYPPKNLKTGEIVIQHHDFPYRLRIMPLGATGQ